MILANKQQAIISPSPAAWRAMVVFAALFVLATAIVRADETGALDRSIPEVVNRIKPSVVSIVVVRDLSEQTPESGNPGFQPMERGTGSGVIMSRDGYVLTNWHVIENCRSLTVRLWDGREVPAALRGGDPATDLAVIKADADQLIPAPLGNSDRIRVGQWAVAVGQPFGLSYTVTAGVVSGTGRSGLGTGNYEDFIQTDANINPGNSGGPLLNLQGEVIGINTLFIGAGQGLGFAIPINLARIIARQLMESGHVVRSYLGVSMQDLTPALAARLGCPGKQGALVNNVYDDGPAGVAGLRIGDVITSVAGVAVASPKETVREILNHNVGDDVAIGVCSNGRDQTLTVTLMRLPGEDPPAQPGPDTGLWQSGSRIGITFHDLTVEETVTHEFTIAQGIFLADVEQGSPAQLAGLQTGDAISQIDGIPVRSADEFVSATRQGSLARGYLALAHRGPANFFTVIRIP